MLASRRPKRHSQQYHTRHLTEPAVPFSRAAIFQPMQPLRRGARALAALLAIAFLAGIVVTLTSPTRGEAAALPAGFQESVAISGLTAPTTVKLAPDGRVFVGERSGIIKVYDSLTDPTPTVFADLRTEVHSFWDRAFTGLALDPASRSVPTCTSPTPTTR
jgi:hypothetical protein